MAFRKNSAVTVATLLAVAALICLGVGLRLLSASGQEFVPTGTEPTLSFVAVLTIVGGLVVFLLGTIALLAARRFAAGAIRPRAKPPLDLIEIQDWGRELEDIRDHLRRSHEPKPELTELSMQTIAVPDSWRPEGQYLLRPDGRPSDPLADLKQTRDQLLEAAERVDAIVQNINSLASSSETTTYYKSTSSWAGFWRFFLRK